MTNELKPCPFCGGKVKVSEREGYSGGEYITEIECNVCHMHVENLYNNDKTIDLWNTRQPAFDWKPIEELPTFFNSRGEKNFDDDEKFLVTTGNKYGEFICKILANDNLLILSHGHKAEFPRSKYTHYALLTPPERS